MPYALCFFLVSLFLAAQTLASLTVLNAGGATNDTNFGATADGLLQWQATGLLYDGCDDDKITIDTCYSFELTDDPSEEVDTDLGEQFVMFVTEQAAAGDVFVFTWKYYLSSTVGTSTDTVVLVQIYSRSGSPSIIGGLSAAHGLITLSDSVRDCSSCASISMSNFMDLTTYHTMEVTFGNSGSLKYTITNAETNAQLLQYSATGNMGSEASIKIGANRVPYSGMNYLNASFGDFTQETSNSTTPYTTVTTLRLVCRFVKLAFVTDDFTRC